MLGNGPVGTIGEVLAWRRRRRFVGRTIELDAFRSVLAQTGTPAVVCVHGPGGIGKTSLLDVLAETAAGEVCVRLDGRDVAASPAAVLDAIGAAVGVAGCRDVGALASAVSGLDRVVLLVDGYERLSTMDDWVRGELLPVLPAGTVAVLAGRTPPASEWLGDPAWRELLVVLPLRNLTPEDCGRYLSECGVDRVHHERIIEVTHGHPLGLSMVADLVARGGVAAVDPLSLDVVGILLRRFVEVVPGETHRRALAVLALARTTTEALLRDALRLAAAHVLFAWLRGLSFVESGPDGLFPHDLAREVLDADLRWRDPDGYREIFDGIRGHVIGRLKATTGRAQQRVLFDAKYMHRHWAVSRAFADWDSFGHDFLERARPGDRVAVLDLVARWEGEESAAIAERWWDRQPEAFHVVRTGDGLRGVLATVDLTRASAADRAADPGAAAAWSYAQRTCRPAPGQVVSQNRFIIDAQAYQRPSPTINLAPIHSIQHWLSTANLVCDFITMAEPESWDDYFGFFEIPRAPGFDFTVGGRRYGLFARDFRRVGLDDWLNLMFDRDLTGEYTPIPPDETASRVLLLSRPEFADAVRGVLRDLRRSDRLAASPLLRSALVVARSDESAVDVLRDEVRTAAQELRADPRDEKLFHAIDRTYLRPAPSQERAAEVLGLPMSTYKRYLRNGVERIVDQLWERDVQAAQRTG